ncbi:MAG: insulinase family protein [Candidatus Aegiribacteria sp.]|nr:insulinase family protein [Candidatus Aegiribacteria sp.]
MKIICLTIVVLFVSLHASVPADIEEFTLSNGIPVITRTIDNNEIEGVSFFIIGGSSALTEETQGLERFSLECAMMGSEDFPGPQWRELMDRTQAEWTSSFNYDYSRYHLKCISEDLPILLTAFGDCLLNPQLGSQAFEQVRESTMQDLQEKYSDPDSWIWFVANDAFMPGHTYRRLPDGTDETVSSFTIEDVSNMLDERIRSGNLLITHAGPTEPEELRDILEQAFGEIPAGGQEFQQVEHFTVNSDTIVVQHREVPTAYAVVKFNAPPQGHEDLQTFNAALTVVNDILWQVLRTDNALTYATFSGATSYQENWGYMYVSTPQPVLACSLMAEVLAEAIENPIDEDVVRGTIEKSRTLENLSAASKDNQCWMMGNFEICTGDWRKAYTVFDDFSELSAEDLRAVLSRWVGYGAWGIIADTTDVPADQLQPWPLK